MAPGPPDKTPSSKRTKEGWEIDESNIVSLQTKQDTRLDNFENQLKDKYGLKKYDVVKDDEDVDALWTYDYVETEEDWSMDNAYVTDLAKKTLNPQLIGGVIIKIGDLLYDASGKKQIMNVKRTLKL